MNNQTQENPPALPPPSSNHHSILQAVVICLLLFSAVLTLAVTTSPITGINPIKSRIRLLSSPIPANSTTNYSSALPISPPARSIAPNPYGGSSDLVHGMDDPELFRTARLIGRMTNRDPAVAPKVAFLYLAKGPLHLAELWERFFRGNRGFYSVYVHSPAALNDVVFGPGSVFSGRRIPSKDVQWGSFNMVEAERRLLASALLDPSNERFVLLSESCIPLFNFSSTYSYLVHSTKTFVEAYDLPGSVGRGRYSKRMHPTVSLAQWRKGSQWFQIDRHLAHQIVADKKYFSVFKKYCRGSCYGDEHYLPTFVSIKFWRENSNRTLTYVDWSRGGPHPRTFHRPLVTVELLTWMRNKRSCEYNGEGGHVCFLFARKFPPNSLVRLLLFASKVMHIE